MPLGPAKNVTVAAAGNVAIVNAVETAVLTLNGVSTAQGGGQVIVEAECQLLTGATTTAVVVNIRRGTTIAGALVGTITLSNLAAAQTVLCPIQAVDNAGEVAGQSYTLTLTQTGGSANGTASNASIQATY